MCTFDLKYNDYTANLSDGLQSLLATSDISDITLAVEGKFFKAHQVILSIFSPYFRELFSMNQFSLKNIVFFMKNVEHRIMGNILTFIYEGSVQIPAEDVQLFVDTANELQIRGLTNDYRRPEAIANQLNQTKTHSELSMLNENHLLSKKAIKREAGQEMSESSQSKQQKTFDEAVNDALNEHLFPECPSETSETDLSRQERLETKLEIGNFDFKSLNPRLRSHRGYPLYADDQHYIYTLQRKANDGCTWHWACEKKGHKPPCGGRIWTKDVDGPVVKVVKAHNHEPQRGRLEALQLIEQIRHHAATTDEPANDIIAAAIHDLPPEVSACLPNMESIKRTIRLARKN